MKKGFRILIYMVIGAYNIMNTIMVVLHFGGLFNPQLPMADIVFDAISVYLSYFLIFSPVIILHTIEEGEINE
jgi:hypothetical protein